MSTHGSAAPEDSAHTPGSATATNPIPQSPEIQKRVRRACQYCRRKRLKCTADKRPCMNCQLYGAECVSAPETTRARKRSVRAGVLVASASSREPATVADTITSSKSPDSLPRPSRRSEDNAVDAGNTAGGEVDVDENGDVEGGADDHVDRDAAGQADGDMHDSGASGDGRQGDVNAPLSTRTIPVVPSDLFTSPGFSFEQVMNDTGIDLGRDYWRFDNFMTTSNPLDEQAVAEQLLAPHSPPETESASVRTPPSLSPRPEPSAGPGRILGVERLGAQRTGSVRAMSSGIFHQKDNGNGQFFGFTSIAAVLALCVQQSTDTGHRLADSDAMRFIVDCGPMCDEISYPDVEETPSQQLPSTTPASQYTNAFFEDFYASYPIVNRGDIEILLERYACNGHRSISPLEQSIVYLITSIGASSRPIEGNNSSVSPEHLYSLAWNVFPHAVATPSLISVQILLLHVLYNIHWSKWSIAWVLCGLAVRVSQSLGLNMTSPQDLALEQGQIRLRARLWAVAVDLDLHLSLTQGRPSACQLSQNDTELLSNKGGILNIAELDWPLSEILAWRVSLAQVKQSFNQAISTFAAEKRLNCLDAVDVSLMKWKEELPLELRPEQQTILEGDAHIDIYTLHLDYFHLLQTIHWSLINRQQENVRESAPPRLRASESICLGACLALVRTLNVMTDENTRARSFRSRSDYFLSAMAIIYRDILRNPAKISARTNLEYMRAIRVHISSMARKHLLAPSLTRLLENMVDSAAEVVQRHTNGRE